MSTLSEFLKSDKNQAVVLGTIVDVFRSSGDWGKRGLFVKVATATNFSAAYIGQVLTGKKPLTEDFVAKIADYLQVSVEYLRGEATVAGRSKIRMVKDLIQQPGFIDDPDKIARYVGYQGLKTSVDEVTRLLLPQAIHELTYVGNNYERSSQETIQNIVIPILTEVAFFGGTKEDFISRLEQSGIHIGYDVGQTFADVENEFSKIRKGIAKELGIFESTLLENAKAFLAIPEEKREEALRILQREGIIPR